jgi:hypothetical protein
MKLDPKLHSESSPTTGFYKPEVVRVIVSGYGDSDDLGKIMKISFASKIGRGFLAAGFVDQSRLYDLAALKSVVRVMPDVRLNYNETSRSESGKPIPETTMLRVREITGAADVNLTFGINGTGVHVAIVDTGVDFGGLDLASAVARNSTGYPLAIDPDGQGLVITNTTFRARLLYERGRYVIVNASQVFVTFQGVFLNMFRGGLGTEVAYWNGTSVNFTRLRQNFRIGVNSTHFITSKSGVYHFGLMVEKDEFGGPGAYGIPYPVLVVDSEKAGVYDTVYVDLSTTYALWTGAFEPDYDFYDEAPHRVGDGSEYLTADYTGDGLPDISAGLLGAQVLDVRGVISKRTYPYNFTVGFQGGVLLPGLDPKGNFFGVMFDFAPHGTLCAASVASRGVVNYEVYGNGTKYPLLGIAPGASIISAKALWLGDVLYAWMWLSGFDFNLENSTWIYTGRHKADVISNSWGISEWPILGAGVGYDPLSILENALTVPGYMSPNYPGTVFVHAMGNGGPGYGTMTSSGFSSLVISVGASTSFHWASSLGLARMGGPSNAADDIIAWSGRGPNSIGEPKPDLVNVGAFTFDVGPVNAGFGNGSRIWRIFGGTSQAVPLTAGSAALVTQALKGAGVAADPFTVKVILMSTAVDIGNDPFVQGAGRVNNFDAVSYALAANAGARETFAVYTTASYVNLTPMLQRAWSSLGGLFINNTFGPMPSGPFKSSSWFAGCVPAGKSAAATFTLMNPSLSSVNISIQPTSFQLIKSVTFHNISDPTLGLKPKYFNLTAIAGPIPSDVSLLIVKLTYPFEKFYNSTATPYGYPSNLLYLYAYNWNDANHDNLVQINETSLVNYGYNWGNCQEVRINNPQAKMPHSQLIGVWQATPQYMAEVGVSKAESIYLYEPITFTLHIQFYKKTTWKWLSAPSSVIVPACQNRNFTAKLFPPADAQPGVYEGFITLTGNNTQTTNIPVSVIVPIKTVGLSYPHSFGGARTDNGTMYDNGAAFGTFDWRWRYESGDWRLFTFTVTEGDYVRGKADTAVLKIEWANSKTSFDVYAFDPSGKIVGTTTPPVAWFYGVPSDWLPFTGVFYPSQNAGPNATILAVPIAEAGQYTIVLHATLFDGNAAAETFRGKIELISVKAPPPIDYELYVSGFVTGAICIAAVVVVILSLRRKLKE